VPERDETFQEDGESHLAPTEVAWRLMRQFVEANSRHDDLAASLGFRLGAGRGKALVALRDRPMTLTQIAEFLRIDAPYATLIVDKLESLGLVERQLHPEDRRRKLVVLTSAGRDALATADTILYRAPSRIGELGATDLRQLIEILERLVVVSEPLSPVAGTVSVHRRGGA
jgi:DNA-binding MarR family transcriptional regulator